MEPAPSYFGLHEGGLLHRHSASTPFESRSGIIEPRRFRGLGAFP
jgi:hypothetical protein